MTAFDLPISTGADSAPRVHPLGRNARVLLCSIFGPFAQDDEYGSRAINPMELYHNQVTRVQGPWSLRMFHRSFGLMIIQQNISAPCTLLDFPTLERFREEITTQPYDIIGISAIPPNLRKVEEMCRMIREAQPQATIVVGGHVASVDDLERRLEVDHVVRGEGVRWFRRFLGEPEDQPIRHPRVTSGFGARAMGVPILDKRHVGTAMLVPGVGCPIGCNFCATSAMFGGKGQFISFYETGDELFDVMQQLERDMNVRSFFALDENFLLHHKRAMRLLELMEEHDKAWSLYVFSSANVLQRYTTEQLIRLGIMWVWLGIEGEHTDYDKIREIDTRVLVKKLQSHGIQVLGSTIIGLEDHRPENIDQVIDYAVSHDANFRHPHIPEGMENEMLLRAFERDFEVNGPSIARLVRTLLQGWQRYHDHPDPRIRARIEWETKDVPTNHAGVLWAARVWYRRQPDLRRRLTAVLHDIYEAFGPKSRRAARLWGKHFHRNLVQEEKRLSEGWIYEPPTFYEKTHQPSEAHDLHVAKGVPSITDR